MKFRLCVAIATMSICSSFTLLAGTIVNDTFENGTATNYIGSANTTLSRVDDSAGIGTGNAENLTSTVNSPSLYEDFAATALTNPGDNIKLALDFRFAAAPGANSTGLRFALESNTTPAAYDLELGSGGTTGGMIAYRASNTTSGTPTTLTTTGTALTINDQVRHSVSLQITKLANGYSFTGTVDGNNFTATDTAHPITSFDRLQIAEGGYQATFRIDNVVVTTNVPEPSGFALLGLSGLALLTPRSVAE